MTNSPTLVSLLYLLNWCLERGFVINNLSGPGYYQYELLLLGSGHLNWLWVIQMNPNAL